MIVNRLPQWLLFNLVLFLNLNKAEFFSFDSILLEIHKFVNIERCDKEWIHNDLKELAFELQTNIYGQPLATKVVLGALEGHFKSNPSKPLTLSFHGSPGVGKTYIASFISSSLYKKGLDSCFVHSYVGSMNFPSTNNSEKIETYKEDLERVITKSVARCPQSLFIFDEVHKLQSEILNKISSLIKHSRLKKSSLDLNKAIFIFISNTGSEMIFNKTLNFVREGIHRDELTLSDFEQDVQEMAYSEGGLKESDLIKNSLIDHFVPFLPLEKRHVEQCMSTELRKMRLENLWTDSFIHDAMKEISFVPEPDNVFSEHGCRKVSTKLSIVAFNEKYRHLIIKEVKHDEH